MENGAMSAAKAFPQNGVSAKMNQLLNI